MIRLGRYFGLNMYLAGIAVPTRPTFMRWRNLGQAMDHMTILTPRHEGEYEYGNLYFSTGMVIPINLSSLKGLHYDSIPKFYRKEFDSELLLPIR
jgi:hypothetical protein